MNHLKFYFFLLSFFSLLPLHADELKIKANFFESDQNKGISVFRGQVHITKGYDEINATKVTIYTDKDKKPIKIVAIGNVSFKIEDETHKKYRGKAQKVIYIPNEQEYRFYTNVHLFQLGDKKEIQGDEVVFNVITGKAYAKGVDHNPVIMIFDIKEKKEEKK